MGKMDKYYTPKEANAILPMVRRELEALQQIQQQFKDKSARLRQLQHHGGRDGHSPVEEERFTLECEIEFLEIEAKTYLASFRLKGIQLKSVEAGLVDFPAILDGEDVLLCWKQGEERVSHYHGYDDGYAGRKKLNNDPES